MSGYPTIEIRTVDNGAIADADNAQGAFGKILL